MPTLNYENAGALTEFDYLQGTITSINSEDDTADVSGACGALSSIPIFFHCEPSSVARSNGALEGAAGAFLVGDSVIVLKAFGSAASSLNNLNQIELKDSEGTATGPKYFVIGRYDGVRKCSASILFFVMNKVDDLHRVERYKVETLKTSGNTVAIFDGVVGLKDTGVNYSARTYVLAGSADTNSVVVQCQAMYANEVLWPWADPIDGIYDWWLGTQQRIPIEQFNETDYNIYEMGSVGEYPYDYSMGPGGNLFYRGYTYYAGAHVSNNIGGRHLMQLSGEDLAVYGHITDGGVPYPPVVGYTYATATCICEDKLLITVLNSVSPYAGWYIGEWLASASGLCFWDSGATPFLSTMTRHFLDLSEYDFYRVCQILYHNGKVYVFYDSGTFNPLANLEIKTYDFITSELLTERLFNAKGDFAKASKIIYQSSTYICVATYDYYNTSEISNIYFLDPITLETKYQVSGVLTSYSFDNGFIAVNLPTMDTMVGHHNRIRNEWNATYGITPGSRIYHLGKSTVCAQVAQEHLTWLLSTGRQQHEDVNGDPVGVRALKHGIISAGENLITRWPTVSVSDDIDYACDETTGWPSSPGHYANMIYREYSQMGWASGCYPASVTELIAGPGQYVNGSYTTSGMTVQIPIEYRGRVRLFVAVFA